MQSSASSEAATQLGRPVVLVVDDDHELRDILGVLLMNEGYQMLSCVDGVDALQRLKSGARPSLILLDLMMPRMDGRRFRELQRQEPALAAIPTVLMTASRNVDGIHADAVIFKPLEFDQLLDIVRHHCG
jgi:CheY-like chemotaxis protein